MAYSDKVVDHYENPRNVGSFEKGDEDVGTGMVGAPSLRRCDKLQIRVNPVTQIIEDAKFQDLWLWLGYRLVFAHIN